MTDRVFPSSRPQNGTAPAAAHASGPNPSSAATAAAKTHHLYNPTARPPYRPSPLRRRRSRGRCLCQCCIWTTICFLVFLLVAASAAAALYFIYRPVRPSFSVSSLRLSRFNLTTPAASSTDTPHVSATLSLVVAARNPNPKVAFFYDPFAVTVLLRDGGGLPLGNATARGFAQGTKNTTAIRAAVATAGEVDLDDGEAYAAVRSDLRRRNRVALEVRLDTRVRVRMGKLKSGKVGIRVSCKGIEGIPPPAEGKKKKKGTENETAVASAVSDAKCDVDLRVKIWKFTF